MTTEHTTRLRLLVAAATVASIAAILAPAALPATSHAFTAKYTGTGSGSVSGATASGHASGTGKGSLIGKGTLTASGTGTLTSQTCVTFSAKVVLQGPGGSIKLSIPKGQACAAGPSASGVSFSGSAKVTGGTSTFAGARGTLAFQGSYVEQGDAVTISFKGRISY